MKKLLLFLLTILPVAALADEGMWLPSLISERIGDMRAKGFRLRAKDIYDVNAASLKDAVVMFDGGCSAELISKEGLIITNHHCGYDAIARLSAVEHDYLTDGYWARSRAEEIPCKGLRVKFLRRMEDVTQALANGETADQIRKAAEENGRYQTSIEPMYYGNQSFLFVYEVFEDVRLVGAPPSSVGNFGADTDNWTWPRHTGDFSMFRIYAGAGNQPAEYAPSNVPFKPRKHFKISLKGVQEGDFTMIYGFPFATQEYITSHAVRYIVRRADPMRIRCRTEQLDRIRAAQKEDPALRIHYASIAARIANGWKKWQGEVLGIERMGTIAQKQEEEKAFEQWAAGGAYAGVTEALRQEYARIEEACYAVDLMNETVNTPYLYEAKLPRATEVNAEIRRVLFRAYWDECPAAWRVPRFVSQVEQLGSPEAYADAADTVAGEFAALQRSMNVIRSRVSALTGAPATGLMQSARLTELYRRYLAGQMKMQPHRTWYPDANFTLRIAYGHVRGYEMRDGERHLPVTSLDGVLAKDNPSIYDYNIPSSLRRIIQERDFGRWGVSMGGRTTVPVNFLADNHTSGGNSGSPVLNARGELIGINFDRTWLSTASDIAFDPAYCRNISLDIRYVLFLIDRVGGAGYLLDEMDFAS